MKNNESTFFSPEDKGPENPLMQQLKFSGAIWSSGMTINRSKG